MSRNVALARLGVFGRDFSRELSLFESAIHKKLLADDAAEFGPLRQVSTQTKTCNAQPWDVVSVDPRGGALTVLLPDPAAPLAIGSWIGVKNDTDSTTAVTVRPLTGTIDGAASFSMTTARRFQWFYSTGAEWKAGPSSATGSGALPPTQTNGYIQRWSWSGAVGSSTTSTWTVPTDGNIFRVIVVGPGGGGGGGAMKTPCTGGGAGGAGARRERWLSRAEVLALQTAGGGSIAITAAGSGAGGAGATVVAGSNGADGVAGMAASSFGPMKAFPGGFGFKGQRGATTSGAGGGGGLVGSGANGVITNGSLGGAPQAITVAAGALDNPGGGGGASVAAGAGAAHGGCSVDGGGGGGTATTNPAVPSNGGRSVYGGGGGGSGGSWDSTIGPGATAGVGGASGTLDGTTHGGGGAGGATGTTGGAGTAGAAGTDTYSGSGGGGGGSARNNGTSNGGVGGAGGFPGGGGAGGGCRVENPGIGAGSVAGDGGAGGAGQVIVESYS